MIPLLFCALSLAFFSAGILHNAAPVFRDLLVLVLPLRHYARAAVLAGRIPLWTDGIFFGAPFLANYQSALFYPPSLIVYALPFPLGLNAFLAFHVFVAGWGAARYLEHRHGLSGIESALGGIVFALGGFVTSLVPLTNQLCAAAWLPWAAAASERLVEHGRVGDLLKVTAVFFLQALAGAPEAWLLTMLLAAALATRDGFGGKGRPARLALLVTAMVFAAALSAFQLLPTAEYVAATDRSAGLSLEASTAESLEPRSLLQFLLPHTFSGSAPDFVIEGGVPLFWSIYIGIVPLALVIAGIGRQAFWAATLALSLLLAMGASTPLFPLLHRLLPHAVGSFRFPGKLFLISQLALAVLAAHGFSRASHEPSTRRFASAVLLVIALLEISVTLASAASPRTLLRTVGFRLTPGLSDSALRTLASGTGLIALRGAALALAGFGFFHLLQRGRLAAAACGSAIVSLTVLDLMLIHRPPQVFVDWLELDRLGSGRVSPGERIFHYHVAEDVAGLEAWTGELHPEEDVEERARRLWVSMVPDAPMVYGAGAVGGSDGLLTAAQRDLFRTLAGVPRDRAAALLAALGVDRLIGTQPLAGSSLSALPRSDGAAPWEYALENRAPHIYFAESVLRVADRAAALAQIAAASFRPGRDAVVVDEPPPAGGRGTIRHASFEAGHLVADVSVESAGLCVVSGTWFEGWQATIDGRPTVIHQTNGVLQGVTIPAGSHTLEMRYRPSSLRRGSLISGFAVIALVGLSLYLRQRQRRPG